MTDKKTQDNGAAPQPEETGANEHGTTGEAEAERSLEDLQTEVETLRDHLLRAKAEVQNILKRSEREKSEIAQYAIAGFARDLLSVADNLRRALEAVPADAVDNPALKALVEGVEMTERELLSVFERHGVRRIAPSPGERFDHTHQRGPCSRHDHRGLPGWLCIGRAFAAAGDGGGGQGPAFGQRRGRHKCGPCGYRGLKTLLQVAGLVPI